MKSNNITMAIKSKFSNAVHALLEPNMDLKRRDRWKRAKKKMTDQEKLELLDKIIGLHNECTNELGHYQYERRERKRIHKQRLASGYYEKKEAKLAAHKKNILEQA